jgi:hypothetical protein
VSHNHGNPIADSIAQEKLERERPLRSSHFADGGSDALKEMDILCTGENPYDLKRLMCERSLEPSHVADGGGDSREKAVVIHQQHANQWLMKLQPDTVHV